MRQGMQCDTGARVGHLQRHGTRRLTADAIVNSSVWRELCDNCAREHPPTATATAPSLLR
jgi:hypothetical protein